ncbi:NAD-P-binding protein [Rhodofomes roseus]|uniref:NAD-P-binding protein n=1 Tax=Rhodofomes roseus TaxID=34475 RepID=A0ABQ8KFW5_9APHY|nr:NAD-P-binding protein [Rhodofomes roseus]KAH9836132.1 NAD-P-binding protein [Rhodofomes roseus]
MPSLAVVRESNAKFSPPTPPVAIFLGGTSGIGQGTAQAFARHTKGNAHIIIVGRNRAAAEAIIATFPKAPNSKYEFVYCDASLIRNIPEVTSPLLALPKVNYMVLSSNVLPPLWDLVRGVQHLTEEGLDRSLATMFYCRTKFVLDLLPLLQKARDAGEDARVLNIASAGYGGPIDFSDMGMRKTSGVLKRRGISTTYIDSTMEIFASRVPGAMFSHNWPGLVDTPVLPWLLRTLAKPVAISIADSGEYMLYALLNGRAGAQRSGERGDDLGPAGYYGGDEVRERVWAHTTEVFEKALAAGSAQSGVNV